MHNDDQYSELRKLLECSGSWAARQRCGSMLKSADLPISASCLNAAKLPPTTNMDTDIVCFITGCTQTVTGNCINCPSTTCNPPCAPGKKARENLNFGSFRVLGCICINGKCVLVSPDPGPDECPRPCRPGKI